MTEKFWVFNPKTGTHSSFSSYEESFNARNQMLIDFIKGWEKSFTMMKETFDEENNSTSESLPTPNTIISFETV